MCGTIVAVVIWTFAGDLSSYSWLRAVSWPEQVIGKGLAKLFFAQDQGNIVIWFPVHFLYWIFIGGILDFTCSWVFRRLVQKKNSP